MRDEARIVQDTDTLAARKQYGIEQYEGKAVLRRHPQVTADCRAAFWRAVEGDGFAVIAGEAGTSKSTTLAAARDAYVSTNVRNWTLFDIENWTPGSGFVAPGSVLGWLVISDGAGPVLQAGFDLFALGLPILAAIPETGLWQDISRLFNVAAGHIFVQSDVEVPEPASLALLGAALIGFAAIRRRKRA